MEYKPEFENSHMAEGGRRLRFFLETCMFTCVFAGESSRCSSRQLSAQDTAEKGTQRKYWSLTRIQTQLLTWSEGERRHSRLPPDCTGLASFAIVQHLVTP